MGKKRNSDLRKQDNRAPELIEVSESLKAGKPIWENDKPSSRKRGGKKRRG